MVRAVLVLLGLAFVASLPTQVDETNFLGTQQQGSNQYRVGVGKKDITGPIGSRISGFDLPEAATALHSRLYARAFVFQDDDDAADPLAFVVVDRWIVSNSLFNTVLKKLNEAHNNKFKRERVILSATHTHSGTSVWSQYGVLQLSSVDTPYTLSDVMMVDGIVDAVTEAYNMVTSGSKGHLLHRTIDDANAPHRISLQRSPNAFSANQNVEGYPGASQEVDPRMTILKVVQSAPESKTLGMINWFALQGTSFDPDSTYISGGNKGIASWLFEKAHPDVVAAFTSASGGDASPNVWGPHCAGTSDPCDFEVTEVVSNDGSLLTWHTPNSTCGGDYKKCQAEGPLAPQNKNPVQNAVETAKRQSDKAAEVFDAANASPGAAGWHTISGSLKAAGSFFNIREVEPKCAPALGFPYLSGNIDGTSIDAKALKLNQSESVLDEGPQDMNTQFLRNVVTMVGEMIAGEYSQDTISCQSPKRILAAEEATDIFMGNVTGFNHVQLGDGGDALVLLGLPMNPSGVAGWRIEKAILESFADPKPRVVVSGPVNDYIGYLTTSEEYGIQRFEGAATLFGPQQLQKIISKVDVTKACISDGSCAPVEDPKSEACQQKTGTNCPPDYPLEPINRLNTIATVGIDYAKGQGWTKPEFDFEKVNRENRGDYVPDSLKAMNDGRSVIAKFRSYATFNAGIMKSRVFEWSCIPTGGADDAWTTVLTEDDPNTAVAYALEDNYLVAVTKVIFPYDGYSYSDYSKCKFIYHSYRETGDGTAQNEVISESSVYEVPSPSS